MGGKPCILLVMMEMNLFLSDHIIEKFTIICDSKLDSDFV